MNIAFWDNQLCERGTTVALFDYAYHNQTILNNKSFVFYDVKNPNNNPKIIEKFRKHFVVHETDNFKEVDFYLEKYNISHIYIIKYGFIDNRISKVAKNCIHCVFECNQPHGEIYSSISTSVIGYNDKYPVVPHMIHLPHHNRNMREELNIPENAIVFGGYGGKTSFDIQYVHNVVYNVALNNPHIYFLFANFNQFCPKVNNIIHLPTITDLEEKVRFINSTDAMIWGRTDGETFGVAIGEFSSKNKPIIASKNGFLAHYYFLKNKAFWYSDPSSLYNILVSFNPEVERNKDWNAYSEFTPENVMRIFEKTYLQ